MLHQRKSNTMRIFFYISICLFFFFFGLVWALLILNTRYLFICNYDTRKLFFAYLFIYFYFLLFVHVLLYLFVYLTI